MRLPKPSELTGTLMDSPLGKSEFEQIAKNLCVVAKIRGDKWLSFTWTDYTEHCTHHPTDSEHDIIRRFAWDGLLHQDGDKYYFTTKMLGLYMFCGEGAKIDPEKPVTR